MPPQGPIFDADTLARTAQVHEAAGFDRVLIGYFTNAPDGFLVGAHVAHSTERLGLLLAHRPGFVAPTLAARKLATLDQLSQGPHRRAHHQRRQRRGPGPRRRLHRPRRALPPLGRVRPRAAPDVGRAPPVRPPRRVLPGRGPGGRHHAVERRRRSRCTAAAGPTRRSRRWRPEIDTFMLWGEPIADTIEFSDRVRKVAADAGNEIRFSVSTRPILGRTEGEAWDRAHRYLETILARTGRTGPARRHQRRLAAAARRRRPLGGVRPLPVHAARRGDRRAGQLDGPRRHARDGGRGARRLRRRRRRRPAHPRLRAAARRRRVRPRS